MRLTQITLLLAVAACRDSGGSPSTPATRPDRYDLGRTPTAAEIAQVNIDANPAGVGLPSGQGTAQAGAVLYGQKCAMCHGPHGEGIDKSPRLIGREPAPGFVFASDAKAPRTIGNYWPYATTLYDYVRRTMPLTAPGSLSSDEIYGLVAYLLSENGIVPATTTMDATTLTAVKMPAQPHFVKDNRTGGSTFR